jgi:hypothetical protein
MSMPLMRGEPRPVLVGYDGSPAPGNNSHPNT